MYNEDYDDQEEQNESKIKEFYYNNKKLIWILGGFLLFIVIATIFAGGKKNNNPVIAKPVITIAPTIVEVQKGSSKRLVASVTDYNNAIITWSSSNSEIVKVEDNGLVLGQNYGKAIVTATFIYNDEPITATCEVTVVEGDANVILTSVNFPDGDLMMGVNSEYKIYLTRTPSRGYITSKVFTSSNPNVVSVSDEGEVKALKEGTSEITVRVNDSFSDTIKVFVLNKNIDTHLITNAENISFTSSLLKLKVGENKRLDYRITPSNTDIKSLVWRSSDTSIATVSSDGTVSALKEGSTTIQVEALNGVTSNIVVEVETNIIDVSDINISSSSITMKTNDTIALTPTVVPSNASNKALTFNSSDSSVVSVVPGLGGVSATFYAHKTGSAQIEIKSTNGITKYVFVTVVSDGSSSGSGSGSSGGEGSTTIVVNPKNVVYKKIEEALSNYVSGSQTISVTIHSGVSKIRYCYDLYEKDICTPSIESSSNPTTFTIPAGGVYRIRIQKLDAYGNNIGPSSTATSYSNGALEYFVNTKEKNATVEESPKDTPDPSLPVETPDQSPQITPKKTLATLTLPFTSVEMQQTSFNKLAYLQNIKSNASGTIKISIISGTCDNGVVTTDFEEAPNQTSLKVNANQSVSVYAYSRSSKSCIASLRLCIEPDDTSKYVGECSNVRLIS